MSESRETIVLLHGFAASSLALMLLRRRLAGRGFNAICWSYPSLRPSIRQHAQRLREYLGQLGESGQRYHIVAHSMGSIVTRAALLDSLPSGLGRIVFLAPPNAGLPAARRAPGIAKRFFAPLEELADTPTSFVNSLPQRMDVDVGIIAARFDVLIPIINTHLPGERAHTTLNATHNSLLLTSGAASLIHRFLVQGDFAVSDSEATAVRL